MVEVFAIQLIDEKLFLELRGQLLSLVEKERKERILRFKFQRDAQRSLLGDVLARSIISQKLNLENERLFFEISGKGKPRIANNDNLFFNVSHAGEWVVAAFSDREVGIDIERIKKIKYNIAEQFFSQQENLNLNKLEGDAKLEYFFTLWTMKESYLKYTGKGLSEPLNSFTITKDGDTFNLYHSFLTEKVYLMQYEFDIGYKLAACSKDNEFCDEVTKLRLGDLIKKLS